MCERADIYQYNAEICGKVYVLDYTAENKVDRCSRDIYYCIFVISCAGMDSGDPCMDAV